MASYNDKGAEDSSEMKNQPAWNQYEAALLLDGYLQISFGENRKEVIEKISNMLRQMAIASGMKIDSIYRNVNGITLQMDRMRMAMTGQIDEGRKPNKVFLDIVSLYKMIERIIPKFYQKQKLCARGLQKRRKILQLK